MIFAFYFEYPEVTASIVIHNLRQKAVVELEAKAKEPVVEVAPVPVVLAEKFKFVCACLLVFVFISSCVSRIF
jgi:hypothetical protein